jgi:hypothetical protein
MLGAKQLSINAFLHKWINSVTGPCHIENRVGRGILYFNDFFFSDFEGPQ